jgi:hypothetical protein
MEGMNERFVQEMNDYSDFPTYFERLEFSEDFFCADFFIDF